METFRQSVIRFERFLEANGYPARVVWVRQSDVLITGHRQISVKVPVPTDNERHAQTLFEAGLREQMGALFATLCNGDAVTYCYVWVPADEDAVHRNLMSTDIKFSALTGNSRNHARDVKSSFVWLWLKTTHRRFQEHKDCLFPS